MRAVCFNVKREQENDSWLRLRGDLRSRLEFDLQAVHALTSCWYLESSGIRRLGDLVDIRLGQKGFIGAIQKFRTLWENATTKYLSFLCRLCKLSPEFLSRVTYIQARCTLGLHQQYQLRAQAWVDIQRTDMRTMSSSSAMISRDARTEICKLAGAGHRADIDIPLICRWKRAKIWKTDLRLRDRTGWSKQRERRYQGRTAATRLLKGCGGK